MNIEEFALQYSFPLDDFQIESIDALINSYSVLVAAPTGSGKTVIAEFAVFDAFKKNEKVIYTTPLKALSNQKYRDFLERYSDRQVGLLTGDVNINPGANLVIMTTEILRNILYQDKSRLDSVSYVVIDECHYMNDDERGTVWEETIIHSPPHIKFIALSATLSNAKEIVSWMASLRPQIKLIEYNIRPVPLYYYYYVSGKIMSFFTENGEVNPKMYKYVHTSNRKLNAPYEIINSLLKQLYKADMLPAIYFIFSRQACEHTLLECLRSNIYLTNHDEYQEIVEHIKKTLDDYPFLKETGSLTNSVLRALPFGIAVHHAGLVPILRSLIEVLFQKCLIKIIFATETLAAGINMPARTTIVSSLSKRVDDGHRLLTVNEFTQMTGRAGRRGKDTIGNSLIIYDGYQGLFEAKELIDGKLEPITSHFSLSYNMVINLLSNFSPEQIPTVLKLSFGQYLANKKIINRQLTLKNMQNNINKLQNRTTAKDEYKLIKKLERKIKTLENEIQNHKELYVDTFYRLVNVLKHFDNIIEDNNLYLLTPAGQLTAHIRAENDLLISLALSNTEVANLSSIELAALLSSLIYESRRESLNIVIIKSKPLKIALGKVAYIKNKLEGIQMKYRLDMPLTMERAIIPLVLKWGNRCTWEDLKRDTSLDDGDIIRPFRQLIDLLHQLERVTILPDSLLEKIKDAINRLDRDILQIII